MPADDFWIALRGELVAELGRRRAAYALLVAKGRLERPVADRELRVWRSIARSVGAIEGMGDASWSEMIHSLRREIALRRKFYPAQIADRRLSADEAARRLELIELWHDLLWHDAGGETGRAARAERLNQLELRAAA
ncbi:hypothetical protein GCM10022253_14430 [Sphingomonas endophytica]|uniref:CHAD domain-containing protein n=1 Tax=Sphingomonas endophytica TaxID=869719 RepID=A0ABR6N5K1_9SPHN|nr:hypothetical protein [Sphingomonas endophytica]MBB5725784.1 hypothetical protein [Sphingomonas endophytica]